MLQTGDAGAPVALPSCQQHSTEHCTTTSSGPAAPTSMRGDLAGSQSDSSPVAAHVEAAVMLPADTCASPAHGVGGQAAGAAAGEDVPGGGGGTHSSASAVWSPTDISTTKIDASEPVQPWRGHLRTSSLRGKLPVIIDLDHASLHRQQSYGESDDAQTHSGLLGTPM